MFFVSHNHYRSSIIFKGKAMSLSLRAVSQKGFNLVDFFLINVIHRLYIR
jgi:hypothetical protein